jgi:hypothetical protein
MTETECFNCDYSETCDWELILQNTVPMTPNCEAKEWHDRSLKQFKAMTFCLREKIYGGGEEVKRATWDNWKSTAPEFKNAPFVGYTEAVGKPITVGQFCENSKNDRDLM